MKQRKQSKNGRAADKCKQLLCQNGGRTGDRRRPALESKPGRLAKESKPCGLAIETELCFDENERNYHAKMVCEPVTDARPALESKPGRLAIKSKPCRFLAFSLILMALISFISPGIFADGVPGPIRKPESQIRPNDYLYSAVDIKDHWAIRHIQRLLTKKMGPDVNKQMAFRPNESLTRGELAILICRVLDSQIPGQDGYTEEYNAIHYYRDLAPSSFGDFDYRDWFGYVERATKRGIMDGQTGNFRPAEPISRGEFIKTVIRLLSYLGDNQLNMAGLDQKAETLNQHLTRFMDVSVRPNQYPGWIKVAQDENILAESGKNSTGKGWGSDWGIDYQKEFYNPAIRALEFRQDHPTSRALAAAVFSNLFCKLDIYSKDIDWDMETGNGTRDLELRSISKKTTVAARIKKIDVLGDTLWIEGKSRLQKKDGIRIFNTTAKDEELPIKISPGASVWFNLGSWYLIEGPRHGEKIQALMKRLDNPQIEGWRINALMVPENFRPNSPQLTPVSGPENRVLEAPVAGFVEIIASLYDYRGRITGIKGNSIEIFEDLRGRLVFEIDKNTVVERKIVHEKGLPDLISASDSMMNPMNKDIYRQPVDSLRMGEEICVKLHEGKLIAQRITSSLLRLGILSNVETAKRQIKPQSAMNEYYICDPIDFRPYSGTGFINNYFSGGNLPEELWKSGDLSLLFAGGNQLKEVEVFVQPADIERVAGPLDKGNKSIFFMAAVKR